MALAKQHGVRRSYDPNLRLALWPDAEAARAGMLLGLAEAEIVKMGEHEVRFVTGLADPAHGVRALWHEGLALFVVTCGAQGCLWFTRQAQGVVPGFKVDPVDTTGAGDAFVAGLLTGLMEAPGALSQPALLDEICGFANAVGAIATTARGAIPALPDRPEVHALMRRS